MGVQERAAANDEHLDAHQPRCVPYTKWTAKRIPFGEFARDRP